MVQENFSRRGQGHVVTVAVEQERAQFFFELMHLHAQGRLRDMQAFGGAPEAEFLRCRHKVPDVTKFHRIEAGDRIIRSPQQVQSNSLFTHRDDFTTSTNL